MLALPFTEGASFNKSYSGQSVPEHIRGGLCRYINEGVPAGDFLTAVLSNDLREALGRADDINRAMLFATVSWLHCEAPSRCWGNPDRVKLWVGAHKLARDGRDLSVLIESADNAESREVYFQVRAIRGLIEQAKKGEA